MFERPKAPDIECDVVVIGAGVSGITSAIDLAKNKINVWLLGSHFESQIAKAGPLKDVTSIPEGTVGLDHIEVMEKEATDAGVQRRTSLCTGIEVNDNIIEVKTKAQKFLTKKVIIATGAKQKKLKFDGEKEFFHKGISDCAVCDFPLYRGKTVGVIGNHKYTLQAVEVLEKNTEGVYLFWNTDSEIPEVPEGVETFKIKEIKAFGSETLEGVEIMDSGNSTKVKLQGLFVEGQPVPSTDFLTDSEIKLVDNYIETNDNFQTSVPNIWAVGDVTGKTSTFEEALSDAKKLAESIINGN